MSSKSDCLQSIDQADLSDHELPTSWDESLLNRAFDEQVQLVKNSFHKNADVKPKSKSTQNQASKSGSKEKKNNNKQDNVFKNRSRIYRYEDGDRIDADQGVEKEKDQSKPKQPASDCLIPPPFSMANVPSVVDEEGARASMLMSWYMAGYHTGYYDALRKIKK